MPVPREEFLSGSWRDGIFDNKVIFVTGGAGSICSAQTRAFVALGGNACILGRNVKKTEEMAKDIETARPGSTVLALAPVDVRDAKAMADAAQKCADKFGGIDFVIAGAAGNFLAPLTQLSANAFKSVMDIDALGSYNTMKATIPYLVDSAKKYKNTGKPQSTGGRIIFISASFHYTGKPLQAHVAAAKAAVDQIAIATAVEFSPYGVTSNVITPGPIEGTEGMERLSRNDEGSLESLNKSVPIGRMGTMKEIADATIYLFADTGSYTNASILVVDGGQWRTSGASMGGFTYPDFLLMGEEVTGVKSGRKSKI